MSEDIARAWMVAVERSAAALDYDAHMDLVSRRVQVYGVPGFELIGYDDWARQSRHEFDERLLCGVTYRGLKMIVTTGAQVMFQTVEAVEASDGSVHERGLEVLLEQEDDGRWRVTQERILPREETAFAGLSVNNIPKQ